MKKSISKKSYSSTKVLSSGLDIDMLHHNLKSNGKKRSLELFNNHKSKEQSLEQFLRKTESWAR